MSPRLSILLPAARRSGPGEEQSCWGDMRVALSSVAEYAPGVDVVVAWSGAEEPRGLPGNDCMRLLRQPAGIKTGSEAWNWCASQTEAEYLLILGDDNVLHPDTLRLFLEDYLQLSAVVPREKIGFLGARSNYVKGPQNIRCPNGSPQLTSIQYATEGSIVEVPMVVPVAALIRHEVFDVVGGFPPTNWFADDLMSWDLGQAGYRHFVSRAYVHHVGQRATGQGKGSDVLWQEGVAWLRQNRPDFAARFDLTG